jgi:hypothetical protein
MSILFSGLYPHLARQQLLHQALLLLLQRLELRLAELDFGLGLVEDLDDWLAEFRNDLESKLRALEMT